MVDLLTERKFWVSTPFPEGTLALESMSGHEALGEPFGYDLSLLSVDLTLDLSKLLGERMTIHALHQGGERCFNGVVTRALLEGTEGRTHRYRATLQPWLALLSYTANCRVFQEKTAVEIIKQVFRDNGFSDFEDALGGSYSKMEYCVQYRESDFNFVSRLMEHEGIYYFFKHDDSKHTLVLADGYGAHATTPGFETVQYHPGRGDQAGTLGSWIVAQQIRPGGYASTDYDFTRPRASLLSKLQAPKSHSRGDYPVFDYPGHYLTSKDGDERVKVRLQQAQMNHEMVETGGDVRGLSCGALFAVTDFPREDQNKEYLVVSAHYDLHAGTYESRGGDQEDFQATFTLLDSQVPFRPSLHSPKPRVEGPQTAVVVGTAGEEIWTDKYGRVKVQFHWDREGKKDEKSSCWVRVAQVWAGSRWGGIHIPRIGQEVIVDFLEGDPDRPIITGRVYNADNMPPYDLPANQTQSGIKSRSSKGGSPSNFNEIRFEDKKGSEQVFIQAEKNQDNLVKADASLTVGHDRSKEIGNNETTKVGVNRTETVGSDESVTIGANQTLSVGANRTKTVTANESVTIGAASTESVGASRSVTIAAVYQVTVGGAMNETIGAAKAEEIGGAKSVNVGAASSELVGGHKSVAAGGNLSESAGGAVSVSAGKDVSLTAGANLSASAASNMTASAGKKATISAADELTLTCGDATIVLKKNGDITINGKKISVTASGDLVMKGSKIGQN